ncbi:MAG: pyrroline-5-carboxylate reductase [Planctomycetales bacterium 4572_13]|nr:MAG: pyrroline-5-carboxylate reductase [Planctomycetales bacterium 4572_13]
MRTIGFIGGGNMAQALLEGVLSAGLFEANNVWVSDVRPERLDELKGLYGIHATTDNTELTKQADIVVLSVKPQMMAAVLDGVARTLKDGVLVISIAAGITTATIKAKLGVVQIVRIMPNTPALIGAGASGVYNAGASESSMNTALSICASVGRAVVVDNEDLIDAVTAVSGSGPAYYFLLMEEMIKAGIELGLTEETAKTLVLQTAKGAALLAESAQEKGEGPAVLRQKVTSPGGTTEAALKVMNESGFERIVLKALTAARNRGKELSG